MYETSGIMAIPDYNLRQVDIWVKGQSFTIPFANHYRALEELRRGLVNLKLSTVRRVELKFNGRELVIEKLDQLLCTVATVFDRDLVSVEAPIHSVYRLLRAVFDMIVKSEPSDIEDGDDE